MLCALGAKIEDLNTVKPSFRFTPPSELPPFEFNVPGDPSSGAFWMAAAALCPGYSLILDNISLNPTRLGLVQILKAMGVEIQIEHHGFALGEPYGQMYICGSTLKGIDIPAQWALDALDELPLVALLGSVAQGQTRVSGVEELRVKESDRIQSMASNLSILGAQIQETPDGWIIQGQPELIGGHVSSYHDHRIALCMYLAQLKAKGSVVIDHPECSAVSYPEFNDLFDQWMAYLHLAPSPPLKDSTPRIKDIQS
jgi:3-phosphoshikimate 1-carboxyvinyltransferase